MSFKKRPTDPLLREQYMSHLQKKINAQRRNETWELNLTDFIDAWGDFWRLRGIRTGDYLMTRIDRTKSWNKDNIRVVVRAQGNNSFMGVHKEYIDADDKQQHLDYARMKAQAKFRKEPFTLTLDNFKELWKGKWSQRGRKAADYCLSRKELYLPWDMNNTIVATKKEQSSSRHDRIIRAALHARDVRAELRKQNV